MKQGKLLVKLITKWYDIRVIVKNNTNNGKLINIWR